MSELLSHSPKIIEFYLSIQILFKFYKQNVSWLHFSWATQYYYYYYYDDDNDLNDL